MKASSSPLQWLQFSQTSGHCNSIHKTDRRSHHYSAGYNESKQNCLHYRYYESIH